MRTLSRVALLLGAAIASGWLYGLAFPPARLQWLAWVALVPLLCALRAAGGTAAALLNALAFTVASSWVTGHWFPRTVAEYFGQGPLIGMASFVAVSTLMGGPGVCAFALAYRALARRAGGALPLLAAAAWVGGELARARLLTGNPWILLGTSQLGVDHVVQISDLTGVYGVSFVLAAVNAALAELLIATATGAPRRWAGPASVAALVGAVLLYGQARLAAYPADPAGGVEVAVVQPNIDFGTQWKQEMYGQNLELVMNPTLEVLRRAAPRLIVWPESAVTFDVARDANYRAAIANALRYRQAQLILGAPHRDVRRDDAPVYNSAFLLAPDGAVLGRYDKRQLLPFAEYPPLPSVAVLRRDFGGVPGFTAGAPRLPLPTVAGRAGILICNEAMFSPLAGERVRAGAQLLINLSNDSWVNDVTFSEIVFNMVAFRAIEQRRWLLRSSTSGPSGIVDPAGRVTVRTTPFTRTAALGRVAPRDEVTVYGRWGDWFPFACVAVVGVVLTMRRVARKPVGPAPNLPHAAP